MYILITGPNNAIIHDNSSTMNAVVTVKMILLCLGLVLFHSKNADGTNILLSPLFGEGSHFFVAAGIGRSLVERGHDVTM